MKTIPEDILQQISNYQLDKKGTFVITDNFYEAELINRSTKYPCLIVETENDIKRFIEHCKPFYEPPPDKALIYGTMIFDLNTKFIFVRKWEVIEKSTLLLSNYNSAPHSKWIILPKTENRTYEDFIQLADNEGGERAVYMSFLIQNSPLVKPEHIPLLESIKQNNPDTHEGYTKELLSKCKNLKETLKSKNKIHNLSHNKEFTEWHRLSHLTPKENEANYFEYDFLWMYFKLLNRDGISIERAFPIKDNKGNISKNPDFIIGINGNEYIALVELTKFDLNLSNNEAINKFIEINNEAIKNLNSGKTVSFESFITPRHISTMLGFDDVSKKIKDKINQCNTYANRNKQHSYKKFIFLDLSQWIADSNIRIDNPLWINFFNSLHVLKENEQIPGFFLSHIVNKADDIPKNGKGIYYTEENYRSMKKIACVICKLQCTLLENNISLVVTFDSFKSFMKGSCLIMFTGNSVELFDIDKFKKLLLNEKRN